MKIPAYRPDIPLSVLIDQMTESLIEMDYFNPEAMREHARALADFSDQLASKARNQEMRTHNPSQLSRPVTKDGCTILPFRKTGVQLALSHAKAREEFPYGPQ